MATRDQERSRRVRVVRARTVAVRSITRSSLALGRLFYPEVDHERPRTRGECQGGPRPCPMVSCHHHLYLDVDALNGSIKFNFPDLDVEQMGESCALDVADRGGLQLEQVGALMNITRERIRQIEGEAIKKIRVGARQLVEHVIVNERPRVRLRLLPGGKGVPDAAE